MSFQNNIFYNKVVDHSVSKEVFDLHHNPEFDMLITFPKPSLEKLPSYYESDDYISHTDGKRSLFEKMYHFVKGIALKKKLKLINSQSQKGKLLDIGAGTGDFLAVANSDGWQTVGIEPSTKAKEIAIKKGVNFAQDFASLESNSFDIITMWHVLEHVPNLEEYISELKRLIKSSGTIIIAVPNFKSYDAKYYGEFWAAFDVPRHLWHFSKTAIQKLFAKQNLKLVEVLPMKFDSFYVSLLSEKYKNGKMNFLKAFWIGLKSNQYGNRKKEYSSHIYVIKSE
ncbi:MAG: class I SAM-dependent methyltransferase [Flavobacterium sp.]|jgi:2-polyprenyl-3-methyl-5-hydroxy-6-metoxy-1,4-benzoquinol methylase|uniref:class I SAM-dependent methyltransferase n=1 Tax=Flavobacterium TaxID=237 RepID=UPI000DB8765E|nr:class I SAM-dependent methyltransferase [Flavobacterium sp.]MCZ8089311.1 class I SAM-dependent methyltransferase [Flavobacterium sp.]MCZ8330014.1 class I SAM-dependent methyltransferase [Flavobacterium sp.]PZO27101.1 MAG: methyltransferase [Flavobacteriaceae bacterium]